MKKQKTEISFLKLNSKKIKKLFDAKDDKTLFEVFSIFKRLDKVESYSLFIKSLLSEETNHQLYIVRNKRNEIVGVTTVFDYLDAGTPEHHYIIDKFYVAKGYEDKGITSFLLSKILEDYHINNGTQLNVKSDSYALKKQIQELKNKIVKTEKKTENIKKEKITRPKNQTALYKKPGSGLKLMHIK
jgi:GNAT superfamily N-acetyltransferase